MILTNNTNKMDVNFTNTVTPLKKFKCKVQWPAYGYVTVNAVSIDAARIQAISLPTPQIEGTLAEKKCVDWYDIKEVNPRVIEFVYWKDIDSIPEWRKIEVDSEDTHSISGMDLNNNRAFRKFLKSKIVDGKILDVKQ